VDAVIAPVILPPEMYVQTHDVSTILIDSSSKKLEGLFGNKVRRNKE